MGEVKIIRASQSLTERNKTEQKGKMRVAAYCRVSTDSAEQLSSYESQCSYYEDFIGKKPEWTLVDIFADEAITGTQVDKREGFQKMIKICLDGKIDLVMTKSISRFARNTVDTLKYVRLLKDKHVAVFFEEENINTMSMDGELLLTILSSVAQQEVQNISEHVKKGLKMKMQRGELVGYNGCLGYDYHRDTKTITINDEQAKIVRYIFDRYINGAGANMICRELHELGYKSPKGSEYWSETTVIGIVKNEKYKGDILFGKTFTLDPINKKRLKNLGEEDQFYARGVHPAIVSPEIFDLAQKILEKRGGPRKWGNQYDREFIPRKFAFSSMCECGFCHGNLTRRNMNSGSTSSKRIWQCVRATKRGKTYCPDSLKIDEECLEKAFLGTISILSGDEGKKLIDSFVDILESSISNSSSQTRISKLEDSIKALETKKDNLLDMRIGGVISKEDMEKKYKELVSEIELKTSQLEDLKSAKEQKNEMQERIKSFKSTIDSLQNVETFDRETFENLVDKIVVGGFDKEGNKDPHLINIVFKGGAKVHTPGSGDVSIENTELVSFKIPYLHFRFIEDENGAKRKQLVKDVTVIASMNLKSSMTI